MVGIVGGATAGAEAAGLLAERGVVVVVFEQNPRPYGKIEDGLPRWHVKLRRKEYETINERLKRPGVFFIPCTKIGRDIGLRELVDDWGFSAIVLAHGAWRDRPLPIDGVDRYIGCGLLYQNAFIHWFNHFAERDYNGPSYEVADGSIVVGGGLASLDVVKVLQIETVRRALAQRGIVEDMLHLEHAGIPEVLGAHGWRWEDLGLRGATLFYRRRIEDMPLAEVPDDADAARRAKFAAIRRRILEKAMQKYAFHVQPLHAPVGALIEGDRLVGLRFQRTRAEGAAAVPIAGAFEDIAAPLVISSIGSVPEPMAGVEQDGLLYRYVDADLGRLAGYETVFSTGNVVTGKGNIATSRRHSVHVSTQMIERFLGIGSHGHSGEESLLEPAVTTAHDHAVRFADWVETQPRLDSVRVETLLRRVRARQAAVGYSGSYTQWLARVTPPDLG